MSNENIQQFLQQASEGNKEEAFVHFNQALMDKVVDRLEDMKISLAQQHFGFSNEGVDEMTLAKANNHDGKIRNMLGHSPEQAARATQFMKRKNSWLGKKLSGEISPAKKD